jgi:3-oxoadipate enol-lactonase
VTSTVPSSSTSGPRTAGHQRDPRLCAHHEYQAFSVQLDADTWPDPPVLAHTTVDLRAISVPTLVVTGGHDMDYFRDVAHHLAASIPGAELVDLPWTGHLPSLESPDEVTATLVRWLATTGAATSQASR